MAKDRCCLCFTRRSGVLAIGILYMSMNSIYVLGSIGGLIAVEISSNGGHRRNIVGCGMMMLSMDLSIVSLILSGLLAYGAERDRLSMMLPWVFFYFFFNFIQTVAAFSSVVFSSALPWLAVAVSVLATLICALLWYWWSVVLVHCWHLATSPFDYHRLQDHAQIADPERTVDVALNQTATYDTDLLQLEDDAQASDSKRTVDISLNKTA